MKGPNASTLRVLLPAAAVTGVLALSLLASPAPLSAFSSMGYGYGYANNCGVKGDGMHDHGKVCPNRPFPGKGQGLQTARSEGATGIDVLIGSTNTGTTVTTNAHANVTTATSAGSTSTTSGTSGRKHGRGNGHARGLLLLPD
jgi:hypothetical protein